MVSPSKEAINSKINMDAILSEFMTDPRKKSMYKKYFIMVIMLKKMKSMFSVSQYSTYRKFTAY